MTLLPACFLKTFLTLCSFYCYFMYLHSFLHVSSLIRRYFILSRLARGSASAPREVHSNFSAAVACVVQNVPVGKHVLRTRVQLSSFVIWTTLNRLPVIVDVALIMEARLAWNALRGLYGAHYVLYRLQIRYQWTETELWNGHMPGVNRRTHGRWGTDIGFRKISRFYDSR